MRIYFSMRHPGALRNFASTLRELEQRGHKIHLAFQMQDKLGDGRLLWELTQDYPGISYGDFSKKTPWRFWLGLSRALRMWGDYLRYLTPEYAKADSLRERAERRVPGPLRWVSRFPPLRSRVGLRLQWALLDIFERAIPTDRWIAEQIQTQKPDLVLLTPLVDIGSDQVDYIKGAQAVGVRTGLCVHSWDNLTNKGLIRIVPDRVFVWNEFQKDEAVRMHGVPPEQVITTGAPVYDQWFARRPSTTREEFCSKVGLDAERPYVLYLCSSPFIATNEADFVARWVEELRQSPDPRLQRAGVLVRPHPENIQPWQRVDLSKFENIVVFPRGGANPVDVDSKNDYFDSLFHSVATVGINTSAQIEAGIVGRPVYSVRTPDYTHSQENTLHFHHLLNANGGLLHMADTFDEHFRQLAGALDPSPEEAARLQTFVEGFVRPHGIANEATAQLADAIEELGRMPKPEPARTAGWLMVVRWMLYPLALAMKAVRQFTRISRKRERALRPLTVSGMLLRPVFAILDRVFRWGPMKTFARQYIVPRVAPRIMNSDTATEEQVAIPRMLQKMARSDRPIIVGPWLSEVGFELLYWIPFLNWIRTYRHFPSERMVVVSRGGAGIWYQGMADRYIEMFDFFTPDQFRQKNEQRLTEGKQKQRTVTEFDRDIMKMVRQAIDSRAVDLIHPMHMYRLFYPYWKSQASVSLIENFASFQRLQAPDTSDIAGQVPDDYVAMRFYFNESFPETEENRTFVRRLLERLTEFTDVVLLNADLHIDDHWDLSVGTMKRVHEIKHLMLPRNNLEVQTKVIARSRGFVGTYGGLSYVPPFYGVNSLAFYSRPESFAVQHLELARRVFGKFKQGSFVAMDVNDLDVVGWAFGAQGWQTGPKDEYREPTVAR